jgi:hypothetical protein
VAFVHLQNRCGNKQAEKGKKFSFYLGTNGAKQNNLKLVEPFLASGCLSCYKNPLFRLDVHTGIDF